MSVLTPFARQVIVASSPQLAALSVGGLTGYPAVLLSQLKENDSSIVLDLNSSSWIASIHGLAGIPSILIPAIMQWKGRKFAFIAACLSTLIGWILTYTANNVTTILIGESFHGFGGNSLIAVSLITISEMVDPRFRSTSMVLFGINQMMGLAIVTFAGYFLSWHMVSLVMAAPTLIALLLAIFWPESPSWLACKGEFKKCEEAFILLRGTRKKAIKELKELLKAKQESSRKIPLKNFLHRSNLQNIWFRLNRKDFFIPVIHMILIMFTFYFSGLLVIFTYAVDIISKTTNESDFVCFLYIDAVVTVGSIVSIILLKIFKNKPVLIFSTFGCGLFLVLASITMYCKDMFVLPKQSLLVCVLGFIFSSVFGSCYLTFSMSTELIPVKHRGLGGSLYIIVSCLFHSGSLKLSPYLFESIDVAGTFLFFATVCFVGGLLIWKYVPETKGLTLQEIESYYNTEISDIDLDEEVETYELKSIHDLSTQMF